MESAQELRLLLLETSEQAVGGWGRSICATVNPDDGLRIWLIPTRHMDGEGVLAFST